MRLINWNTTETPPTTSSRQIDWDDSTARCSFDILETSNTAKRSNEILNDDKFSRVICFIILIL